MIKYYLLFIIYLLLKVCYGCHSLWMLDVNLKSKMLWNVKVLGGSTIGL